MLFFFFFFANLMQSYYGKNINNRKWAQSISIIPVLNS